MTPVQVLAASGALCRRARQHMEALAQQKEPPCAVKCCKVDD